MAQRADYIAKCKLHNTYDKETDKRAINYYPTIAVKYGYVQTGYPGFYEWKKRKKDFN